MDKTKLYYIVQKGTNNRTTTNDRQPLMIVPEHIDDMLDKTPPDEYEKITVEEYERIFTEAEEW